MGLNIVFDFIQIIIHSKLLLLLSAILPDTIIQKQYIEL